MVRCAFGSATSRRGHQPERAALAIRIPPRREGDSGGGAVLLSVADLPLAPDHESDLAVEGSDHQPGWEHRHVEEPPVSTTAEGSNEMELELRASGPEISLWSGATEVASIQDDRAQPGNLVIIAGRVSKSPPWKPGTMTPRRPTRLRSFSPRPPRLPRLRTSRLEGRHGWVSREGENAFQPHRRAGRRAVCAEHDHYAVHSTGFRRHERLRGAAAALGWRAGESPSQPRWISFRPLPEHADDSESL